MIVRKRNLKTEDPIIDAISWTLKVPAATIFPDTRLRDDLCLDPVDILLLIVKLESHFEVYLTPEEVEAIETVSDACFFIRKHAIA